MARADDAAGFILASAAFLSAITAMRIAIHGRESDHAKSCGHKCSEASRILQSRGLVLRVADRIYSDQPINGGGATDADVRVADESVAQAHVVLSLGQRQLQITAAWKEIR